MPETEQSVKPIDLVHPEAVFVNRLPDLGVVQERVLRSFKTAIFQAMRVNLKTENEAYTVISHDDYLAEKSGDYALYGVLSLQPAVRGMALITVQGRLLSALVDDLFGAGNIPAETSPIRAEITLMEARIGECVIQMMADAIGMAFRQHFEVDATISRFESHPALASVGDATEPFCVMSATLALSTGSGLISIALPYRGLEPYRDVLSSPVNGLAQKGADIAWREQMEAALAEAPLHLGFEIGTVSINTSACAALEPGQILPLRLHRGVRAISGGSLLAEGRYGAIDDHYGVTLDE